MTDTKKIIIERFSQDAADRMLLIKAGWLSLRAAAVPADASPTQLEEMETAFYAGAQHLFASIMTILAPGIEPTQADLDRLTKIAIELAHWENDYRKKHGLPPR